MPPSRPPPATTRSSPSTAAWPPSAMIAAAIPPRRSLSFTRSSLPPTNHVAPRAHAASAASTGTSSITSGSSSASIDVPMRPPVGSTRRSPTGSPSSSPVTSCSVRTPIRAITARKRVLVGLSPTRWRVSSPPVTAAAATRKAAEDTSPGRVPARPPCWKEDTVTAFPERRTAAPRCSARRSVWSRVGAVSSTVVSPVGGETGEQQRALHLCARRSRPVADPVESGAHDAERGMTERGLDHGAHLPERLGHALHGSPAQALVPGQHALEPAGPEDTREQPHRGPGVATVERFARSLQSSTTPFVEVECERAGSRFTLVERETVRLVGARSLGSPRLECRSSLGCEPSETPRG